MKAILVTAAIAASATVLFFSCGEEKKTEQEDSKKTTFEDDAKETECEAASKFFDRVTKSCVEGSALIQNCQTSSFMDDIDEASKSAAQNFVNEGHTVYACATIDVGYIVGWEKMESATSRLSSVARYNKAIPPAGSDDSDDTDAGAEAGEDEGGSDLEEFDFSGTWSTACDDGALSSEKYSVQITDDVLTLTRQKFSAAGCDSGDLEKVTTLVADYTQSTEMTDFSSPAAVDFKLTAGTIMLKTDGAVTNANALSTCGYNDWQRDVE